MTALDRYAGNLDAIEAGLVSGWAVDRERPGEPCLVDVYVNRRRLGTFAGDRDRPDLAQVSPEGTRKGFAVDLTRDWRPGDRVEVYFGGTDIRLPAGPRVRAAAGAPPVDPEEFARALATPFIPIPDKALIAYVSGEREGDLAASYRAIGGALAADIHNVLGDQGCDIGREEFHLVDLGCGCGRVASFLAGLMRRGRYSGFDVWHEGIAWAQRHISTAAPYMEFHALSREALGYEGRRAFALPLAAASADAVVAVSLFTHLDGAAATFYLAEIGRVLMPGGLLYLTAFLRDPETLPLLRRRHGRGFAPVEEEGVSSFARGGYLDSYVEPDFLEREMRRRGLDPGLVRHGSWRGPHRSTVNAAAHQDLLVARRAGGLDSAAAVPL